MCKPTVCIGCLLYTSAINKHLWQIAGQALYGALILLQIGISNRANCKALFGKESCQRSWLRDWHTFCVYTMSSCKSALQIERIARLSLVKRAVSVADWEIGKHFVYIRYSVVSLLANQFIVPMSIPPIFLTKNHLPLHVMPCGYKMCIRDSTYSAAAETLPLSTKTLSGVSFSLFGIAL